MSRLGQTPNNLLSSAGCHLHKSSFQKVTARITRKKTAVCIESFWTSPWYCAGHPGGTGLLRIHHPGLHPLTSDKQCAGGGGAAAAVAVVETGWGWWLGQDVWWLGKLFFSTKHVWTWVNGWVMECRFLHQYIQYHSIGIGTWYGWTLNSPPHFLFRLWLVAAQPAVASLPIARRRFTASRLPETCKCPAAPRAVGRTRLKWTFANPQRPREIATEL